MEGGEMMIHAWALNGDTHGIKYTGRYKFCSMKFLEIHKALPHRVYSLICPESYEDQHVQWASIYSTYGCEVKGHLTRGVTPAIKAPIPSSV